MKRQRYIDRLNRPDRSEAEDENDLRTLLNAQLDAENRQKWAQQLAKQGVHREPTLNVVWGRKALAVAAAIAVLVATVWWLWSFADTPVKIANSYVRKDGPLHLPFNFRGDTGDNLRRREALQAYQAKDYARALLLLDQIPLSDSTAHTDLLLRGLCHFYRDENEQAADHFLKATAYSGGLETERQWYLALAYLRQNEVEKARTVLQQLSENELSGYGEQAKKVLERLE